MKFACSLIGISPRHYAPVSQAVESNGFESILASEHIVLPEAPPLSAPSWSNGVSPYPSDMALFDPFIALGYIACATTTLRLGTFVYVLPLRHPMMTARSIVTLDRLSGGRVTLGIGVGWLAEEFAILDHAFDTRGRETDEIIDVMRRLWSEDVIAHNGEFFNFPSVRFEPKPLQRPFPPIEVGGASAAAQRRAGWLGDGWIADGQPDPEDLRAAIATVHRHRRDAARADLPFEITANVRNDLDTIRRAEEVGVTRVVVGIETTNRPTTPVQFGDFVKRFSDEVITHF